MKVVNMSVHETQQSLTINKNGTKINVVVSV